MYFGNGIVQGTADLEPRYSLFVHVPKWETDNEFAAIEKY